MRALPSISDNDTNASLIDIWLTAGKRAHRLSVRTNNQKGPDIDLFAAMTFVLYNRETGV